MTFSSTQCVSPVRDAALHKPQASRTTRRIDAPAGRDRLPALDRRLLEQYFNTYCREMGCFDPRMADDASLADDLRGTVQAWRDAGYAIACVTFPHDGSRLYVALDRFSPMGFHRLAPHAALQSADGTVTPFDSPEALTGRIAGALAFRQPPADKAWPQRFAALMHNSIERVRYYHDHAQRRERRGTPFVRAEQSLLFGHVFHVTSKASEGFGEDDMQAYAPELGASFRLHYFAVSSRLFDARAIDASQPPIDPEAMHAATALLGDSEYRLLPCHPWQADYLLRQDAIKALLARRELISLGALGEVVWPTSSVRTVWLPLQRQFLKLSLDVRITNFVRNNPPEQVARALDASRYIAALPAACRSSERFEILLDAAGASLSVSDDALRASTTVVYRQAMRDAVGDEARVLATVLEEPANGAAPLQALLEEALGEAPSFERLAAWWMRYLDVTLMPLLRLFACHGVSLEAHLQNAMVAFQAGWPVRGYVRDMEGASISRTRCARPELLSPQSPALYSDDAAWKRLRYYVLVNHIGHVVASIARTGACDEAALWRVVEQVWARDIEPAVVALLDDVRRRPTLPAKANMLSCFGGHGEAPAWVEIPNPLADEEHRA
ncbi:IucA/IucC family siderophore biosynthesis protein [Ralstonia solanacearum]|uniref:IucA/IucC family protein n=1 Tax=Ralstonia solanacearum TaxID=305 RepID=UPI00070E1B90|nr:IucA/IucC family protein [Ralstonia solanacearum]MBB6593597.1 IucA/IucC family siderophore biosynthesis protein [Ralstonia solanacearum]MBB6597828.1 IucA/IucC family siderophore biosynthesis protein [Ralstonia solanacearum]MDB0543478.1 IucA/IucC family siderophore biosynthesis protein [Ralstonia solanacearum]MDB0551524.1 IucA/IucC family siderophore biosynthesis protein [Ralstonia solanacearum]MDB0558429.1 IucA/IucC family siderophore biosynthesis protein [Ralstonia solanacearum]